MRAHSFTALRTISLHAFGAAAVGNGWEWPEIDWPRRRFEGNLSVQHCRRVASPTRPSTCSAVSSGRRAESGVLVPATAGYQVIVLNSAICGVATKLIPFRSGRVET